MNEKELRQKFVNQAIAYVGVKEGSSGHKEIVDGYNSIVPLPVNYKLHYSDAWCAAFVSFVGKQCGLLNIIPAECSCDRQIALAKKMGIWIEDDTYVPKTGDIVLYDWNDNCVGDNKGISDHVGIVVSVDNNTMRVAEGNYKDSVGYRYVNINGKFIRGFIAPKFSNMATKNEDVKIPSEGDVFTMNLKTLLKGSKGEQVRALQILLVGRGYKLPKYGIDGDYGDETVIAVKAFQKAKKIAIDGIAGKDTFNKLLLG